MPDSARPRPAVGLDGADAVLRYDREHLWHPYSSMASPSPVLLVESADGVVLTTSDGERLIDAMASWWCAIHGYRHPALDEAVRRQLASMSHVMFGGLTHRPAVELAETLVAMTPEPLDRVFFADSGSVSVEVAIKMAVQYQRGHGRPGRTRLLSLRGGYHGDTAGAMSLCDPVTGMHAMFAGVIPSQVFAPRPPGGLDADIGDWEAEVRRLADLHRDKLAAVVCEPVLQGAGGMHVYPPDCLRVLRDVADSCDLLLIFDEIATGFGRTGELFGADHAGIAPDVMCVGKALTGGYLTLAATLCTDAVARGLGDSESGVLMHGPTFMANPLACAVASANLALLADGTWRDDVRRIETGLTAGLEPLRGRPGVVDVRVLGAVGVVQLDHAVDIAAATTAAVDHGVWLRPFRDLVYTMPPYIASDGDVAAICSAVSAAAAAG
jgi:adenosylmethionine---8-amino-7-oxononanoate aminotransferase